MELAVFLGCLALLLPTGIPIAIVLILCAMVLMYAMGIWDPLIVSQQMVMGTNNFPLMAIPFFMLSGELMTEGGLSKRIVQFANILVGRFRGGLGFAAIIASMLFAGLSGSAVADTAALGGILVPLMVQSGYKPARSTGLICSGAIIAPIIPPSIPMIVLGATVGISIGRLFMAGIVPGIILGVGLIIAWKIMIHKDGYTGTVTYTRKEAIRITIESLPALVMPLLIVGGIRFGIFTPTEAGAFAAVYALIVSLVWYREISIADLPDIMVATASSTAIVMFIVASATAIGWLITVAQIPAQVASVFGSLIDRPTLLLIVINIFLLALGMVMDLTPNLLIFGPVLFPVIKQAGIDPYFFGVIMVLNLCIGLITPPIGTILYLGCGVGNVNFGQITRGVLPFLITELIVLSLFILCPEIITIPLHFFMR